MAIISGRGRTVEEDGSPLEASWPRICKARKGGAKVDGKRGPDLTYWRFVSDDPAVAEIMEAIFATEEVDGVLRARSVRGLLFHDTVEDAYDVWRKQYGKSENLVHSCDGLNCNRWWDEKALAYSTEPIPCPELDKPDDKRLCQPQGRLRLLVPELMEHGFVGYVEFLADGDIDIPAITRQLAAIKAMSPQNSLDGVPVIVKRVKKTVPTPARQGFPRGRKESWLVEVVADPTWIVAMLGARKTAMLARPVGGLALPEPEGEVVEDSTPTDHPQLTASAPPHDANGIPILKCEKCNAIMPHGLMKKAGKWGYICKTEGCGNKAFDVLSDNQRIALMATATERGLDTSARSKANRLAQTKALLGRDVATWSDLNPREAGKLMDMIGDGTFDWVTVPKAEKPAKEEPSAEELVLTAEVVEEAKPSVTAHVLAAAAIDADPEGTADVFDVPEGWTPPAREEVVEGVVEIKIPTHIERLMAAAAAKGLETADFLNHARALAAINAYLTGPLKAAPITRILDLSGKRTDFLIGGIELGKLAW